MNTILFDNDVLESGTRIIAHSKLPKDLDTVFWLSRTDDEIFEDAITKQLEANGVPVYVIISMKKQYHLMGAEKFLDTYPEFSSAVSWFSSQTITIKNAICAIYN